MKVFISGSKILNKEGGDWLFPDSVRDCLDSIMSEGNEILIGDCLGADTIVQEYLNASKYSKVTVYSSGSHPKMRSNLGQWEVRRVTSNGRTPYAFRIEKDFHMVEDCDYGVTIWDGNSKGTFINILCLCALKKPCKLYLIQEDRWLNINLLEDLRELAGSEGEITDKEIREVLTKCDFSDEMIEYLTSKSAISPYQLIDIISRAPITLDEKMLFFSSLGNKRNLKFEVFSSVAENIKTGKNFKKIKHDIRAIADIRGKRTIWTELYDRSIALEEAKNFLVGDLDHNLPLFLFSEWYDIDELQLKSSDVGLFATARAVEKYIANEEPVLDIQYLFFFRREIYLYRDCPSFVSQKITFFIFDKFMWVLPASVLLKVDATEHIKKGDRGCAPASRYREFSHREKYRYQAI